MPEERFTFINDVLEKLTGLKFLPRIQKPCIRSLEMYVNGTTFAHRSTADEELVGLRNEVKYD